MRFSFQDIYKSVWTRLRKAVKRLVNLNDYDDIDENDPFDDSCAIL